MASSTRTKPDVVAFRMNTDKYLLGYKRKVQDLRRIVAGDMSPIDEGAPPQSDNFAPDSSRYEWMEGFQDLLVTDFENGTSNHMQNAVRTMILSVSERFPSVEFENAFSTTQAQFVSKWIRARLGPQPRGCGAQSSMVATLCDFCVSGVGFQWSGVEKGRSTTQNTDMMRVVWDPSVKDFSQHRWRGVRVVHTLEYWREMFGEKVFSKIEDKIVKPGILEGSSKYEQTAELAFYYDTCYNEGTATVLAVDTQGRYSAELLIDEASNPFYTTVDSIKRPFIPIAAMDFIKLPGSRYPLTLTEGMIANLIATRSGERLYRHYMDRIRPYFEVEKGAYDQEALDDFETGEVGGLVQREPNRPGATLVGQGTVGIDRTIADHIQRNKEELITAGGTNPYASGGRVQGIDYAAEVKAIQDNSSLLSTAVSERYGSLWTTVIQHVLCIGKLYDRHPYIDWIDGVPVPFNLPGAPPLSDVLPVDLEPVVAPSSMMFEPRAVRMQRAKFVYDAAIAVNDLAPNARKLAFEELLKAAGVRNVEEYFEVPPDLMVPAGQQNSGAQSADTQKTPA